MLFGRYDFIEKVKKETIIEKKVKENISDKIDKIFLNKWLSFPIFAVIMFFVYYLSAGVIGRFTVSWMSSLLESFETMLKNTLETIGASEWLNSLIIDGVIKGVGAVIGFIPQLTILFVCISVLETTGYMSRIALLLDKIFRKIGLSGKSLIPFIIGSGCSVPGIMGTRIIENQDEREMTAILVPFMPCSAKLPIIALFSGYFFKEYSGLASVSLYFFSVIIIILSALILKKFIFKHTSSTYISELPEYKIPNIKYVIKDVFEKISAFIKRAGTIILICSIVLWFLLSFSFNFKYGVNVEDSILATIGKSISWVFYPMLGENSWGAAVSTIQGLIAKEQVISSMSVISGFSKEIEAGEQIFKETGMFSFFTSSSAYAFMVFNLFSAPCFGAIGAMKKELGGTKKVLKAVTYQTISAWVLATIVYQIGSKIENGAFNFANLIIILGLVYVIIKILFKKTKEDGCRYCPYNTSCSKEV